MRVYISADMEGVTGLVDAADTQLAGRDYELGRAMMTQDVNAAVRGAFAGGADEVVVNDAHGSMRNLLADQVHERAVLVRGRPKVMGMLEELDGSFGAMLAIGYHARAGELGVLSHSFMGHEIEDMWLDDRPMGEIGFAQATAAALGVPLVMLSGDDVACAEATAWDASVATVAVKEARDRFAARLRPAAEARRAIEQGSCDAVRRAVGGEFRRDAAPGSGRLAVRWQSATVASLLEGIPGVKRRDSRTVEVHGALPELYRLHYVLMRVAASVTGQDPYC